MTTTSECMPSSVIEYSGHLSSLIRIRKFLCILWVLWIIKSCESYPTSLQASIWTNWWPLNLMTLESVCLMHLKQFCKCCDWIYIYCFNNIAVYCSCTACSHNSRAYNTEKGHPPLHREVRCRKSYIWEKITKVMYSQWWYAGDKMNQWECGDVTLKACVPKMLTEMLREKISTHE